MCDVSTKSIVCKKKTVVLIVIVVMIVVVAFQLFTVAAYFHLRSLSLFIVTYRVRKKKFDRNDVTYKCQNQWWG